LRALVGAIAGVLLLGAAGAPDLDIFALQTTGPGRIGDCNAVVARLHNAGTAATAGAPAVRLDVTGTAVWTRTARAAAPLEPGSTVEVWFQGVPLEGGVLTHIVATADPDGDEHESNETNNLRRVPRDPQLPCGAPEPPAAAGFELRVLVVARAGAAEDSTPLAAAEITVTSPLGAGVVLASGVTGPDGRAILAVPPDPRSPVLKVTASAPGCPAETRLATPTAAPARPLELTLELVCASEAVAARGAEAGVLEIETALPGSVTLDDGPARAVTFGTRITVRRPGVSVRLRASSAHGTVFHDATVEVPREAGRLVVIDAPALRIMPNEDERATAIVEDLRTGLLWTPGAPASPRFEAAAAICDDLDRGGATDWRLPTIDDLVFVLEARDRATGAGAEVPLDRLDACCWWSSTAHAGLQLTYYVEGGHIYGRRAEEAGIGALCVHGSAYDVDPLLVPDRYHDRLPGRRRFRPRD
jgi:hypothetical protein